MCQQMLTQHDLLTNSAALIPADCNYTPVPELYSSEQIMYICTAASRNGIIHTLSYVFDDMT